MLTDGLRLAIPGLLKARKAEVRWVARGRVDVDVLLGDWPYFIHHLPSMQSEVAAILPSLLSSPTICTILLPVTAVE